MHAYRLETERQFRRAVEAAEARRAEFGRKFEEARRQHAARAEHFERFREATHEALRREVGR